MSNQLIRLKEAKYYFSNILTQTVDSRQFDIMHIKVIEEALNCLIKQNEKKED